jgi:hypothetical protein
MHTRDRAHLFHLRRLHLRRRKRPGRVRSDALTARNCPTLQSPPLQVRTFERSDLHGSYISSVPQTDWHVGRSSKSGADCGC